MKRLGGLALLVVCGCVALVAQSNFATLSGSIEDQQKRPIIGATLQLKALATGEARLATANGDGLYEIAGLRPGAYQLEIRASGFAPMDRTLQLEVGQEMRLDLRLNVGEKRETVDVMSRAEVLKTSDASLGEVVET